MKLVNNAGASHLGEALRGQGSWARIKETQGFVVCSGLHVSLGALLGPVHLPGIIKLLWPGPLAKGFHCSILGTQEPRDVGGLSRSSRITQPKLTGHLLRELAAGEVRVYAIGSAC